ncbi:hypothetical protein [Ilumatobacter sp.]|uniref:hypothetical protein n=1 Tax=Ilumatobacter sp. TaxID=1967498 RepID=UPI003AF834C8
MARFRPTPDEVITATATTERTEETEATRPPSFAGFELELGEGSWWEFAYQSNSSSWSQGSAASTTELTGRLLVSLGAASVVDDVEVHSIDVQMLEGDEPEFEVTRWQFLGRDGPVLVGSTGDGTVRPIFDPTRSTQAGGGFFAEFADDELVEASVSRPQLPEDLLHGLPKRDYLAASDAVMLSDTFAESRCDDFGDLGTICSRESDESLTTREYLLPGAGPFALYTRASYIDCGGNYCSGGGSRSRAIVLLDYSLHGGTRPASTPTTVPSTVAAPTESTPPAPAATYVELVDQTRSVRVEVPADWRDRASGVIVGGDGGDWPFVMAAPDLAGLEGSFDGSGIVIQVSPDGAATDDIAAWFEAFTAGDQAVCELGNRSSTEKLESMMLINCDGQGTALIWPAGSIGERTFKMAFEFRHESELAHFRRAYESLTVCSSSDC